MFRAMTPPYYSSAESLYLEPEPVSLAEHPSAFIVAIPDYDMRVAPPELTVNEPSVISLCESTPTPAPLEPSSLAPTSTAEINEVPALYRAFPDPAPVQNLLACSDSTSSQSAQSEIHIDNQETGLAPATDVLTADFTPDLVDAPMSARATSEEFSSATVSQPAVESIFHIAQRFVPFQDPELATEPAPNAQVSTAQVSPITSPATHVSCGVVGSPGDMRSAKITISKKETSS